LLSCCLPFAIGIEVPDLEVPSASELCNTLLDPRSSSLRIGQSHRSGYHGSSISSIIRQLVRLDGLTCSIGVSIAVPTHTSASALTAAHLMKASRPTGSLSLWARLPNELRGGEAQWRSGRRAFDLVLPPSRVRSGSLGRTQPRVEDISTNTANQLKALRAVNRES
jgi:hypothetical protein